VLPKNRESELIVVAVAVVESDGDGFLRDLPSDAAINQFLQIQDKIVLFQEYDLPFKVEGCNGFEERMRIRGDLVIYENLEAPAAVRVLDDGVKEVVKMETTEQDRKCSTYHGLKMLATNSSG
jgi:hypothetical protein